ncbi:fibronectin type III domain-containing protein, putative, partial [Bodo saltans]
TLAIPGGGGGSNPCYYLCITSNGQYLYVTTQNNTAASTSYTIVQISTTSGAAVPIAGGPSGATNGPGFAARFNYFRGIALNSDESALIIADYWNNLIRRMDLSTKQVSTIAGVTTAGSADGPGSTATFNGPEGAVWYCNASSAQCGFLVGEYGNIDLRFISMERYTATLSPSIMARSETESCNSSATTLMTSSRTLSVSVSMNTASPTMATSPSVSTLIPSLTVTTSASSSSTLSTTRSPSTTSSRSVHTMSSTKSWSFRHTNSSVSSSLSASTTTTITAATSSFVQTSTTTLSSTQSRSTSTTKSNMRFTATTSVSYSLSATGALSTFSHTCTRHTDSPTSTVFCALIYGPSELTTFTSNLSASVAVALAMQSAGDETTLEIETPIVAFPLSRGAVLLNPALALNLSLTLANSSTSSIIIINSGDQNDEGDDAWVLDSVVLDVLPTTDSSSFPLLTTTVPFTTVRSTHLVAVNDHRQQFVACVLQPPNVSTSVSAARWLPASLSALQSVTLSFRLVLRCPSDSAITRSIAIQVLSPAEDLPLAEQVKTASSVAQYTSLFAVPAAGGAVGRLSSVRTLVACNGDSVVTGILPLSIAAAGCGEEYDDDDDNTVLASARGAVLGNLVLWIASCLLMALMVLGYSGLAHVSRLHAMEALGLPSPLMSLVVVTVPSTVTGSFYLLHSLSSLSLCGVDVLMAIIGVSMCVFPTLVLSVLSYVVPQRLVLVRHGKHGAITTTMRGLRVASRARAWKELIFARRVQWVERVASSPQHTQNHHGADGGTKVSVSNQRQQEQQRYHADCWSSCLPDAMPRCLRGAT